MNARQPMGRLIETDIEWVSELIDPDLYKWRTELVRSIFVAPNAESILQIPLRRSIGEDWIAWHHERTGIYSVRLAYRALLAEKEGRRALDTTIGGYSGEDDKWKRLWRLDVLPRVRVFWWRVLKGILPDYATLTRRHVREDSTCSVCNIAPETLFHAMMECGHAIQFWTAAREILHLKVPRLHPDTWMMDILCDPMFNQGERERIISIMSAIWDSRNQWTHDDVGYDPRKAVESIVETMAYLENKKVGKEKVRRPPCTWHGPSPGVIKINSDGAVRSEQGF
jgi:hypothetical protein